MSSSAATRLVNETILALQRAFPMGLFVRRNTGAARNAAGQLVKFGRAGMADISGIIEGRAVEVECKSGTTSRLSTEQKDWRDAVRRSGGIYVVARDPSQAVAELNGHIHALGNIRDVPGVRPCERL